MKTRRCYIYTRVSTSMQVDGYSLDAQKDKLKKYAEFQDMVVAGEYSDEGKSGKNIEGRPQFLQMLKDIESGKDKVEFVLVFKLSRFGRNAADVLSSLQRMQDFGVNLICVEDGIDSSKDSGKLMISVLSAVAEIERENILVQTMEGRRQKAREGKWNGGFAPYGYRKDPADRHRFLIDEAAAETVRNIYTLYLEGVSVQKIAERLNRQQILPPTEYKRKIQKLSYVNRQGKNQVQKWNAPTIYNILKNQVYTGAMVQHKTEKISYKIEKYRNIPMEERYVVEGMHEAIISKELFAMAQEKRQRFKNRNS